MKRFICGGREDKMKSRNGYQINLWRHREDKKYVRIKIIFSFQIYFVP